VKISGPFSKLALPTLLVQTSSYATASRSYKQEHVFGKALMWCLIRPSGPIYHIMPKVECVRDLTLGCLALWLKTFLRWKFAFFLKLTKRLFLIRMKSANEGKHHVN